MKLRAMANYESISTSRSPDATSGELYANPFAAQRCRLVVWWGLGMLLLSTVPLLIRSCYDDDDDPHSAVSLGEANKTTFASMNSQNHPSNTGNLRSELRNEQREIEKGAEDVEEDYVKELFFHHQKVNHFRDDNYINETPQFWANRYYQTTQHFKGPGHPIFLIVGGEGATDDGFFYPFVTEHLAPHFGAAVLQIEHRFYGPYPPVKNATRAQLLELLTVEQALADMVYLLQHVREHDLDCNIHDHESPHYCPVISVGGSYPGALSALLRVVYPDKVDIAYASSAPLLMYAQSDAVDPNVYYDIVTSAADTSSPGCAAAVKHTLSETVNRIDQSVTLEEAAAVVDVCAGGIPSYVTTKEMLADVLVEIASFKFADDIMGAYPPGNQTSLFQTCRTFQTSNNPMRDFLFSLLPTSDPPPACFDIRTQIPKDGKTLDDTDGDYDDGMMWDWQTCSDLIFVLGFSETSMFPPKVASYDHLIQHCRQRFGITPRPFQLVEKWHFNDLSDHSYILFTNGMQDLWSGGSFLNNVSDTVLALNFPKGAHHSDLTHVGPSEFDSDDLKAGFILIQAILETWLKQIQPNAF